MNVISLKIFRPYHSAMDTTNRGLLRAVCVAALVHCSASFAVASDESELRQQFMQEAPVAWNELAEMMSNVRGRGTRIERSGKNVRLTVGIDFLISGGSQQAVIKNNAAGTQKVHCNSEGRGYAFSLMQRIGDLKYFVSRLEPYTVSPLGTLSTHEERLSHVISRFVSAPWVIEARDLRYVVRQPGFKLHRVAASENHPGLVEVGFEYIPSDPDQSPFKDSLIVLNPSNYWAIERYECITSWGALSGAVDYAGEASGGLHLPTNVVQEYWDGKPGSSNLGTNFSFAFSEIERQSASADKFTLTAFGVPEVDKPSRANSRIVTYIVVASLIVVVILVLLRRTNLRGQTNLSTVMAELAFARLGEIRAHG